MSATMTEVAACTHWWVIEGIASENTRKERVSGECKHCHEKRTFEASFHGHTSDGGSILWRGRKAEAATDEYASDSDAYDN